MNGHAEQWLALVQRDAPPLIIGVILCTVGAGMLVFAVIGRSARFRELALAGAFATLYGLRLAINTAWFEFPVQDALWLPYLRSIFEYLVPIAGTSLFVIMFEKRWRVLNLFTAWAFVLCAAIAIPFEIAARHPFAGKPVVDALVLVLMIVFIINLLSRGRRREDRTILRMGAGIFGVFVLNEHLHIVPRPSGFPLEAIGFIFFIGSIAFVAMRKTVRDEVSLLAVQSELSTARTIQLSIIPREAPRLEGATIAAFYRTASDVGGDFYDFLQDDDGWIGLFIADVSGHGIPAALLASMLKMALATQSDHIREPARLLSALNQLLCGRMERNFITAAYAAIDTKSWTMLVAGAGHPRPLLRRAKESISELRTSGPVLGRFKQAGYDEVSAVLNPSDALVLYTDGLTEMQAKTGEQWGETRLFNSPSLRGAEGERGLQDLVREASDWSETDQFDDDVTLVILCRNP
ncbi:MAG: PP2C family protein-serine/threonine phosphatase [Acidobacteriota bacterium]